VIRHWKCVECKKTDVTNDDGRGTRYHRCPKMRGINVPFLPDGTKAKLVLREREDYIGGELVQLDPEHGRPVASLTTIRDNGQDVIVYAPTATAKGA